jgi:anti-sigma factor RsiW
MNCTRFQDLLFEYLDGELSQAEQACAVEHLAGCAECRSLLEREKAAGARVSKAFQERTAELRLSAGFERRILGALEAARPAAAGTFERLLAFARRFGWSSAAGAAAVVVAAVLLIRGHATRDAVGQAITQPRPEKVPASVPVQAAFVSSVYTFRLEGDQVVDLLEYQTNVVDGTVLLSRN